MIGVNGIEIESQFAFVKECCSEDLIKRQGRGDIYDYSRMKMGNQVLAQSKLISCIALYHQTSTPYYSSRCRSFDGCHVVSCERK